MFNLDEFIASYVTKRSFSMFISDIENNCDYLKERIENKSVLVIGGAGSIGSSFIKALLPFKPASLVVVDNNENALAELNRDIRSTKEMYIPNEYVLYPFGFETSIFKKMYINHRGFDIVGNFSALKHVRSEKNIYSVEALLQNNVIQAKRLMDLLANYPPEVYFCVSTDKAANPVNVMGASKRIMEDIIFCYSDIFPIKTARFANVAFSNGSLPAGFLERISKEQPISAPLDVRRYFVSPEESGQICPLSCILGKNREIFFPKLEDIQMVSFDEIARKLLEIQGYEVLECCSDSEAIEKSIELRDGSNKYPVHFSVSDTSGEKKYEEFVTAEESIEMDRFNSLGVIVGKPMPDKDRVWKLLMDLETALKKEATKEDVVHLLEDYLPNFKHIETGKSLDYKM